MSALKELEMLFGPEESSAIPSLFIKQLLRLAWSGNMSSNVSRAMCWRVLLGLVSSNSKFAWPDQIESFIELYETTRSAVMPSLDKVEADPLSALSSGDSQNEEWSTYYKNIDLINFIKGDLDRLYISGIEEGYFHLQRRRDLLLSVLLVWSFQHPTISYRQGMHEIVGYILYCVEIESDEWSRMRQDKEVPITHLLYNSFTMQNIESHTFTLFTRIMNELEPLYDAVPSTIRGIEGQPYVVQFCAKIQEHYLHMLDPELSTCLEENCIQAQLYGIRWSRLLLGREFTVTDDQIYHLWDFMFASCYEAENASSDALLDDGAPLNINSVLASVRISGYKQMSNIELRKAFYNNSSDTSSSGSSSYRSGAVNAPLPSPPPYVCTPLLGALADFMLAMLMQLRDQLIGSDPSTILGLLMHYPETTSIVPIIDYADMIRRGVILKDAQFGYNNMIINNNSSNNISNGNSNRSNNANQTKCTSPNPNNNSNNNSNSNGYRLFHRIVPTNASLAGNNNNNSSTTTTTTNSSTTSIGAVASSWLQNSALNGMGRRVSDKLHAVSAAMGNGINEIVNTLAEYSIEDDEIVEGNAAADSSNSQQQLQQKHRDNNIISSNSSKSCSVGNKNNEANPRRDSDKSTISKHSNSGNNSIISEEYNNNSDKRDNFLKSNASTATTGPKNIVKLPQTKTTNSLSSSGTTNIATMPTFQSSNSNNSIKSNLSNSSSGNSSGNYNNTDGNYNNTENITLSSAVADRMMNLADCWAQQRLGTVGPPSSSSSSPLTALPGLLEGTVSCSNNNSVSSHCIELQWEMAARRDSVRKLRALADVLSGLTTIEEYDRKFTSTATTTTTANITSNSLSSASNTLCTANVCILKDPLYPVVKNQPSSGSSSILSHSIASNKNSSTATITAATATTNITTSENSGSNSSDNNSINGIAMKSLSTTQPSQQQQHPLQQSSSVTIFHPLLSECAAESQHFEVDLND